MTKISGSKATYGTTTASGVTLGDLATKMAMLSFIALLFLTLCHKRSQSTHARRILCGKPVTTTPQTVSLNLT
jgi:hypothetical protein